jgi:hypothetical protein
MADDNPHELFEQLEARANWTDNDVEYLLDERNALRKAAIDLVDAIYTHVTDTDIQQQLLPALQQIVFLIAHSLGHNPIDLLHQAHKELNGD